MCTTPELAARGSEPLAMLPLQHQTNALDELFRVDRLGQIFIDAELEAANLFVD
jgi:hypothetical protein